MSRGAGKRPGEKEEQLIVVADIEVVNKYVNKNYTRESVCSFFIHCRVLESFGILAHVVAELSGEKNNEMGTVALMRVLIAAAVTRS